MRESLRGLLAEAGRAPGPDGEPEIAQASAAWPSNRQLARWLARQPDHSPLRDYLFLTFLRDRRPSRLTLAAPKPLRTLIRDVDRWSVVASALLALIGTLAVAVWYRLASAPLVAGPPLGDGIRVVPMPSAAALPEASTAVVTVVLAVLVVSLYGRKRRGLAPATGDAAVPGLIARIAARRLPILAPWVATSWVGTFILTDFAGSPPGLRSTLANLVATLTLGGYFYLELGISSAYRARLGKLEARLDAGAGAEIVHELTAFLRGRAATDLKRRLLRRVHAKVRAPTVELVRGLFELRHNGSLEPRTKSLLERVTRHLEDRYRQQHNPEDMP